MRDPEPRRVPLLHQLRRRHTADEREERSQRLLIAVLEQVERPFDRDAQLTHVTASAIVVGCRGTLLHVHRRLGRWLQPGGHIDSGEAPAAAALREAREETGVPSRHPARGPTLIHVDAHPALDHLHLDLRYLLEADDAEEAEPHPNPEESQEVQWFSWEQAAEVADASLSAALGAARASLKR